MKLTRKQIREGLDQVPTADILGAAVNSKLTTKQKAFAMNIAKGDTGAAAYRKAYNSKGKPKTQAIEASKLRARPDIAQVTEAYSMALEGQRYQTPAALRALVIDSLVKVIIDPEANHGQVVAAAKVLGTVTEVAAFTQQSKQEVIISSSDARAKVMMQLKQLMRSDATDAHVIENEAQALVDELRAPRSTPTTPNGQLESLAHIHTIPLEQSQPNLDPPGVDEFAPPSVDADLETPPGHVSKTNGVG